MISSIKAIKAVKNRVNSKAVDENSLKEYTVYVIVRKYTVDVVYVGMTKKYSSRKYTHTRAKNAKYPESKYTMFPIATGLSYKKARALEQTIITAYTLDSLNNMINLISPRRWNKFLKEFKQVESLLLSWIKND